jgi:hypothetical protein
MCQQQDEHMLILDGLCPDAAPSRRRSLLGNYRAPFSPLFGHLNECLHAVFSRNHLKVQRRQHGARGLAHVGFVIHHEDVTKELVERSKRRPEALWPVGHGVTPICQIVRKKFGQIIRKVKFYKDKTPGRAGLIGQQFGPNQRLGLRRSRDF